jgi:hypothetical protein
MKRIKTNRIFAFAILLLLASCTADNPPSRALNDFIDREEVDSELIELYFYPSTVRMLDKFISTEEGGLLKGVEEGRLFYTSSDSADVIQSNLPKLRKELAAEGFELLGEFRRSGTKTVAYVREKNINRYVVVVGGEDVPSMMVELKGDISMKTLQGLSTLNSDKVMDLLDLGIGEEPTEGEETDASASDSTDTSNE